MSEAVYVIGYARVSTPRQAQTGESLEVQETAIKRYCDKQGWILFPNNKVFKEPFTGTNTNRPAYNEILEMLKANRKAINIKHFLFWDFGRLTRAGTLDYDKIWEDVKNYNVTLRDTTGVIQDERDAFEEFGFNFSYKWATARPSEDTEREKIEDARKERITILQRLIAPEIRLTQAGYHIGRPDYGFCNKKIFVDGKKKCIQTRLDPEATYIERIYKLRSEGLLSDQQICDDVNAMGYKSQIMIKWNKDKTKQIGTLGGNKLDVKQLQKIIKRFSYCGVICEKWTKYQPIKAKYDGLVSIDEWNKANRGKVQLDVNSDNTITLLKDVNIHSKKRKKYNSDFPFKGILMCETCGKIMKASASTGKSGGKFGAYHCERGHARNAFSQKDVEEKYTKFLNSINFTEKFMAIFEKTVYTQFRNREGELAEYTIKANINVADLESEKLALIKSFPSATLDVVKKSIEEQISTLQRQIDQAKVHRSEMEVNEMDVVGFIGWCKGIMEHPAKILTDIRSEQELVQTASLFFEEFPTYTQIVSGTPKLTRVFKVSEEYKVNKDLLVTPRRIELRLAD
ncbi:MAG: hypothetical protein RL641_43 [Candidatus Parcubacteria bacterium]